LIFYINVFNPRNQAGFHVLIFYINVFNPRNQAGFHVLILYIKVFKRRSAHEKATLPAHDGDGRLMAPGGQLMAETDNSWIKGKREDVVD